MWRFIKRYWDLIGGAAVGAVLCIIAHIRLETVQLYYSIIILFLCSIGLFKTLKQAMEKQRNERKHNIVDTVVDNQIALKAVSLADAPTKEGEKIGKIFINLMEVIKSTMNKFKQFFDKFKGYMLTIALAILSAVEMCGGYINQLCGGVLTIKGIAVLPVVTLGCTVVVGLLSNGYTKEQREKIKALFSKSSTNELVQAEIKKQIKDKKAKLTEFTKILNTKKTELANLQSEKEIAENAHAAKKEMYAMQPQLATAEDVQLAANAVVDVTAKIAEKEKEIADTEQTIENLKTTINALNSQL